VSGRGGGGAGPGEAGHLEPVGYGEHGQHGEHAGYSERVEYVDDEDGEYLAGGAGMVRDRGLLLSALSRPRATAFGAYAYPDVWTKAAVLGESLARNHPLVDRNKRTAFEAMLLFLDYNGEPYTDPAPDDAVAYMLRLAQGGYGGDTGEAARDLRRMLGRC
jgi:death-on-curing protein